MLDRYQQQIEAKKKLGYGVLDVMENHLSHHDYFVGEIYSIADIV
ncbi:MAG TPA: hypothetical protein DCZ03_04865 [Gammaproteobacteria bacterium]|nr:hypothetical protein [Gammaproteobacteria bacterium]